MPRSGTWWLFSMGTSKPLVSTFFKRQVLVQNVSGDSTGLLDLLS